MESRHFHLLEHFTVILYDKTSDLEFVDEARKSCLAKTMENTPLMQDALLQHDKKRKGAEEERTNGKRKRREKRKGEEEKKESSSYYKWESLPGAYDKGLSALPGIDITVNPSTTVAMGKSACHCLVITLHH